MAEVPSMTRGGGARALRLVCGAIYVVAWAWLLLGMLLAGAWLWASLLAVTLVAVWAVPVPADNTRFGARAAAAAIAAGLLWAAQPLVASIDDGTVGSAWSWQAAALLLLPAILETRERERIAAHWLGTIGWLVGWLPVFVTAALAGGIGGPLGSGLAAIYVPVGILLFVAATVPFAIVAAWTRVVPFVTCGLLVIGAVVQTAFAGPDTSLGAVAFVVPAILGIGWLLLGVGLLRSPVTVIPGPDPSGDRR
jgi:hypothetical protein